MTSQPTSERAQGTERRPRARRALKKRGILPSFGDIVLPIVSVAAVGLLILAGRQFFINGVKTSPGITSTRAYADSPALIAERERERERANAVTAAIAPKAEAVSAEVAASKDDAPILAEVVQPDVPLVTTPKPASTPAPKQASAPAKATIAAKTTQAKLPANKQWRVQIGAYTSRAGAEEAVKKLKKAGYKATVYSNPASKHFKVWLEGGPTKFYADRIVEQMKKLGYKTSFSFPPAK